MAWEKLVEERIQEAMANGEFENLPGQGKPLDLDDYFSAPVTDRMGYSVLKSAGVIPPEVELLKEIAALKEAIASCPNEARRTALREELQSKQVSIALFLEQRRRRFRQDAALGYPGAA